MGSLIPRPSEIMNLGAERPLSAPRFIISDGLGTRLHNGNYLQSDYIIVRQNK